MLEKNMVSEMKNALSRLISIYDSNLDRNSEFSESSIEIKTKLKHKGRGKRKREGRVEGKERKSREDIFEKIMVNS